MTVPVVEKALQGEVKKAKSAASAAKKGAKSASANPPGKPKAGQTKRPKGQASPSTKAPEKKVAAKQGAPAKTSPDNRSDSPPDRTPARRAADFSAKSATRRVASAKQSHAKTKSAVEGKYRRDRVSIFAEMRPKTRMLAAEFMGAIVMAGILLFVPEQKTYHERVSRFLIQMTGITGIFFVLALASSSEKVSRYAIPFGLLIDVSMLAYLFKQGGGKAITKAVGGEHSGFPEIINDVLQAASSQIAPGVTIGPKDDPNAIPGVTVPGVIGGVPEPPKFRGPDHSMAPGGR